MAKPKWTSEQKYEAKRLYFRGHDIPYICDEIPEIPQVTLKGWIHGRTKSDYWQVEREAYFKNCLKEASTQLDVKKAAGTLQLALDVLYQHLMATKNTHEGRLPAKEMKLISDIMSNLDRMVAREEGKPSQTIRVEHYKTHDEVVEETRAALDELMTKDPMAPQAKNDSDSDGGRSERLSVSSLLN